MRTGSPSLLRRINGLAAGDYATVGLNRPGPYNWPKVHEDLTVTLTSYPGTPPSSSPTTLGRCMRIET